ncbi:MAG: tRNA pseudouridine(55) synthase TruB [Flavobacteriales bacterium]|jgi:tRNA pseudouridine55 synthase|nr:tRNA pseudouridine(55) synthase TruB [Flavobacteriales bacterium]
MNGEDFISGKLILIDKEKEWSSFDVVNKIRSAIKKKFSIKKIKVGHAGTLDPLATGLLVLCTGKMTKKIDNLSILRKRYLGTITLGATTPSYDCETAINNTYPTSHITEKLIKSNINNFIGVISQKPPIYSAIKKDGKRLYMYARAGEKVEINSRKIEIFDFKIMKIDMPNIDFEISCSKGTYIRSIANDFGENLNSGAYLSNLKRTEIGDFKITNASKVNEFIDKYLN